MRRELHPQGVEIVTVSLELSGPQASRPYIEAAHPEHPSLLDPTHQLDALFGVVNIPNVVWIDEQGVIVRPAEPGWPGVRPPLPAQIAESATRLGRAKSAPDPPADIVTQQAVLTSGQDRLAYPEALRDWARNGATSAYVLDPMRSSPAPSHGRSPPRRVRPISSWPSIFGRPGGGTSPSRTSTRVTVCSRTTGPTGDRRGH